MELTVPSSALSTLRLVSPQIKKTEALMTGEIVAIKKMKKKYYRWEQCIA